MSTTSTIGAFWPTNAPGSTARRATKPLTGETITVLARLIRSSSSRAVDCVVLRPRQVELRDGGLIPRFGVVERLLREELTREQVARALGVGLAPAAGRPRAAGWWRATLRGPASCCLTCSCSS